jgi:hypothetical protein
MSIAKMMAAHPDAGGKVDEPLALAVRHAMFCAAICNSCADACAAEKHSEKIRQCIRTCVDSADICEAAYRVLSRRTGATRS